MLQTQHQLAWGRREMLEFIGRRRMRPDNSLVVNSPGVSRIDDVVTQDDDG